MERREAIEIVREYYPSSGKDLNEALETLIPELKESEDERIRKEILDCFRTMKQQGCFPSKHKEQYNSWIAWLEKQGEKEYALKPSKDVDVHKFVQYIERQAKAYELNLPNRSYDIYGFAKDILSWLEKQGEQNPKSTDFIPADCTSDAKNENRWHKVEDSLPDNNREVLCKDAIGNFFIGRYYNDGDYWEVSMYDEPDKSNKDNPPVIMWMNIPSYEQVLANSAKTCKDEQKFKVGDWVVYNGDICQIVKREEGCNKLVTNFGIEKELVNERNLSAAQPWTIQDVKDGDVLVYEGEIFMIKSYALWNKIVYHCCYDGKFLHKHSIYDSWGREDFDKVQPATEEQRDLLFQKIKEAGYEWDAEKKELKKIEQNPAWSKEDEKTTQRIVDTIMKYAISPHSIINGDKPNLEYAKEFESWLKSLKFRIQPQWKPSDEQMGALDDVISSRDVKYNILSELWKELNKLKG